jgi:hypothetical protein
MQGGLAMGCFGWQGFKFRQACTLNVCSHHTLSDPNRKGGFTDDDS